MGKIFPAIRLSGNKQLAERYIREGKKELFRTREVRDRMGVPTYQRITEIDEYTTIRTLITKDQEFIFIEHNPPEIPVEEKPEEVPEELIPAAGIYSGFAYSHQLIDAQLYEFNPTAACREANKKDFTDATYQPVTRLALESNTEIRNSGAHAQGYFDTWRYGAAGQDIVQTNLVHPCQYTGPVARACSLALGLGTLNQSGESRVALLAEDAHAEWVNTVRDYGFKIEYDFKWAKTHNICRDDQGDPWLVELNTNGVYARRLPVIHPLTPTDPAELAAVNEFGGIPSGEAFPTSIDPEEYLVLDGGSSAWAELRSETIFSDSASWAFNDDGSEGRVCTYKIDSDGWMVITYWKIRFHIWVREGEIVNSTATLEKIDSSIAAAPGKYYFEDGRVTEIANNREFRLLPVIFYNYANNTFDFVYLTANTAGYEDVSKFAKVPENMDIVCWVGWINGEWHEIRYRAAKIGVRFPNSYVGLGAPWNLLDPGTDFAYSGHIPMILNNGSTLDPEALAYDHRYPRSTTYEVEDKSEKIKSYYRRQVVSNTKIAGPAVVRTTEGHSAWYERMEDVYLMHWEKADRYEMTDSRQHRRISFIIPPYNRSAYFVYDYDWAGGLMEARSYYGTIVRPHSERFRQQYISWPDAFIATYCTWPYPYPYTGYDGMSATQELPPPDKNDWPGLVTGAGDFAYEYLEDPSRNWQGPLYGREEWMSWIWDSISFQSFAGGLVDWATRPIATVVSPDSCGSYYSGCYCSLQVYNRWIVQAWDQLADFDFHTGDDPPSESFYTDTWTATLAESRLSGGGMYIYPVDTVFDESTGERIFNYAKQYPRQWSGTRHWFPPFIWGRLKMGLVTEGFEYKDFGNKDLYVEEDNELVAAIMWDLFGYVAPTTVTQQPLPYPEQGWTWWCQHSVLGEPARIYSNPYVYQLNDGAYPIEFRFGLEEEGVHPAMPDRLPAGNFLYDTLLYDDHYRYLTFVGVNGP